MKRKPARNKVPAKKVTKAKKKVQPIPAGYSAVTPYLSVRGAAQAIEDPFGHMWHVATHKEDLSKAEMARRSAEAAKQGGD